MAEVEASENRKHPEREQRCQREAIGIMLGVPMKDVKLDLQWQRKYLAEIERAP